MTTNIHQPSPATGQLMTLSAVTSTCQLNIRLAKQKVLGDYSISEAETVFFKSSDGVFQSRILIS